MITSNDIRERMASMARPPAVRMTGASMDFTKLSKATVGQSYLGKTTNRPLIVGRSHRATGVRQRNRLQVFVNYSEWFSGMEGLRMAIPGCGGGGWARISAIDRGTLYVFEYSLVVNF